MKMSKLRKPEESSREGRGLGAFTGALPGDEASSLPMLVARIFARLNVVQRVRVLRRLLVPVGPMALAVVGGGAFAKFVAQARWPRMSISLEDAASVTSSQIFELVRYVEQSSPHALQQAMALLARDAATIAAVGASFAFVALRHLSERN